MTANETEGAPIGRGLVWGQALRDGILTLRRAVGWDGDAGEIDQRLHGDFLKAEQSGLMLASIVRVVIIVALSTFFALTGSFVGDGLIVLVLGPLPIALTGILQYEAARRWPELGWPKFAIVAVDCVYLATFLIVRHSLASDLPSVALAVKEGAILFFTAFLVHGVFAYSPRFILWIGVCITAAWLALLTAAAFEPGTFFVLPYREGDAANMWLRYGDPFYLPIIKVVYDYVVVAFLTAGLSVAVARGRRLVKRAAVMERSRSNLARYFSPRVVELLSKRDNPLGEVNWQSAAVLFADIRGFTTLSESLPPEDVIKLLREFHGAMAEEIFAAGGTVDKVMGDGLLATFGVPEMTAKDANNALSCAQQMLERLSRWNVERQAAGRSPINIGIGLHHGPVVLGDIGNERMMTFTVIGDTVNVASRLQALTKELHTTLVASAAFADALRREQSDAVANLVAAGQRQLRGRVQHTEIYVLTPSSSSIVRERSETA